MRRALLLVPLLLGLAAVPLFADTFAGLVARYEREKDRPYPVRIRTIQAIADLGTDEAVGFIEKVIREDKDTSIRLNSIYQLARIQLPSARSVLLDLYRNGDSSVRSSALNGLANNQKAGIPPDVVKEVLASEDQNLRSTVLRYLARTGDPRFLPEAERFLAAFPSGSSSLISTLTSVKSAEAARLIIRVFDESRQYDRDNVPKYFADGDDAVQQTLVDALRSGDGELVDHAIALSARGRVARAEPPLTELLAAAAGTEKAVLIEAVGAVGARTKAGRDAILAAISDDDPEIATAGARAVRTAPAKAAVPRLIERMGTAPPALRAEIRVSLERITGRQYGDRLDLWKKWWAEFGDAFSLEDVRKPDPDNVDTALVNLAIDKGAAALKALRGKKPPWMFSSHPVGTTALVCLALNASGLTLEDPDVRAGVKYLIDQPVPETTYDLGIEAMALEAIGGKHFRRRISECAARLVATQLDAGLWGYPTGDGDNSNTQYAVLGLRSAARVGMHIPEKTWRRVRDHFLSTRCEDGGWSYQPSNRTTSSSSMTAAGISSLLVCLENMKLAKGEGDVLTAAIAKAYTALGERMNLEKDSLYALYGIERAGVLGGRSTMAKKPWYPPGARRLLSEQNRDGSWHAQYDEAVDTSFAILFLKKFTTPISTK